VSFVPIAGEPEYTSGALVWNPERSSPLLERFLQIAQGCIKEGRVLG
jgi:hypothetical protein